MTKRQRNNTILITIIVLLTTLIGVFYFQSNKDDSPKKAEKPSLSIVKYDVYDYDKVDFRFIIAEVGVESNEALNIPLDEIFIDKLSLDNKDEYVEKLRDNDYKDDLSSIDEVFITTETSKTVTLFMPVIDENTTKVVLNSKHFDDLLFDLNKNVTVSKEDKDENDNSNDNDKPETETPDTEIPDNDTNDDEEYDKEQTIEETGFKINVNQSFKDRDFTYYVDGSQFNSASSEVLHAFPVSLISKDGETYAITDAKFIFSSSGNEMPAQDESFEVMGLESIINSETNSEIEGGLLFISYSQSLEPITYEGKLLVKVNNGDWFELEVSI